MALFKDTGANALCAIPHLTYSNLPFSMYLKHKMVADKKQSTIFKINMGASVAGFVFTFNGFNSARYYGDIPKSYIKVTEVLEAATI